MWVYLAEGGGRWRSPWWWWRRDGHPATVAAHLKTTVLSQLTTGTGHLPPKHQFRSGPALEPEPVQDQDQDQRRSSTGSSFGAALLVSEGGSD